MRPIEQCGYCTPTTAGHASGCPMGPQEPGAVAMLMRVQMNPHVCDFVFLRESTHPAPPDGPEPDTCDVFYCRYCLDKREVPQ